MGKESWETTSGLLDDFTLKVEEAWFGEDEENDDERIYLFLRGLAIDNDSEDAAEEEDYRERFRVGTNWETVDKGAGVENATGKQKFNKNSGVGRLIRSMVADGATAEALAERGDATEAETYIGLTLHLVRIEQTPFENDDGDKVEWNILSAVDVEFPKKAKAKSKSKKDKGKGDSGKAEKGKTDSKGGSLRKTVIAFAGLFGDDEHTTFVTEVLDVKVFPAAPDIEDDDELHAEILDEEGKVWTKARKVWAESN
jgi:hypothetical protein